MFSNILVTFSDNYNSPFWLNIANSCLYQFYIYKFTSVCVCILCAVCSLCDIGTNIFYGAPAFYMVYVCVKNCYSIYPITITISNKPCFVVHRIVHQIYVWTRTEIMKVKYFEKMFLVLFFMLFDNSFYIFMNFVIFMVVIM